MATSTGYVPAHGTNRQVWPPEATAVCEALTNSPYVGLRLLICEMNHGVLVLRGNVASFYQKQLAQAMAQRAAGGLPIRIEIDVNA